ncbi:MAG: hypothetical protein AAFO07_20640 [Bacteroidota bacterium]
MKNKDSLEQYIQTKRSEFDRQEWVPRDRMWAAIQQESDQIPNKSKSNFSIRKTYLLWSIAATLVLAVGAGIWISNQPSEDPVMKNENTLASYFPELADEEQMYRKLISEQENKLNIGAIDKAIYEDIFSELHELESIHQEYLQDLSQYQEQELLIQTLLKYYERKLRILERLSFEIEKRQLYEKRELEILQ